MRRNEIQKCAGCGKGVMHDGALTFYRVTVEHMIADVGAIQRQHGLEMMLGSPALAAVMGPDQSIAQCIGDPAKVLVCQDCGIMPDMAIAALVERTPATKE